MKRLSRRVNSRLAVPGEAPTLAAAAGLSCLEAVLAIDGAVATGLKWDGGLLPAPGTDYRCSLRLAALVSTTTSSALLFILLCLTAWFAALGRRVTAFAEKILVFAGKRECLSAVATHELQILSHMFLSSLLRFAPFPPRER